MAWDSSYYGILSIEMNNKSKYIFPLQKFLPNCVAAQWVSSLTKTLKVMNSNQIGAFMIFVLRFYFLPNIFKDYFWSIIVKCLNYKTVKVF